MHEQKSSIRSISGLVAAAYFTALGAWADTNPYDNRPVTPAQSTQPTQPVRPSVNNETFKKLRTTCETDAACGRASGDICADAAALLLGSDIPDEYREIKEDQRIKIALRLLERGVDNSNVARGRAYDWYNRVSFLGISSFADPIRAQELMDMMVKSGYPGGVLRKIRSQTSIISFGASEAEKREACATANKLLNEGKLDADSSSIAKEVVGSGICTGYATPAKQ